MIKSWDELKVKDFQRIVYINDLHCDDAEKNLRVAAILGEMEYEDIIQIPLCDLPQYMDNCEFLKERPRQHKPRKNYVINGKEYTLLRNTSEMTVAQYIDFQTISVEGFERHIPEMLAIFLVPKGHNYNDGYANDEAVNDVMELNMGEAYNIADFFTRRCVRLIRYIPTYLKIRGLWMRLTAPRKEKEMAKAIALEMRLMGEELDSMFGYLSLRR